MPRIYLPAPQWVWDQGETCSAAIARSERFGQGDAAILAENAKQKNRLLSAQFRGALCESSLRGVIVALTAVGCRRKTFLPVIHDDCPGGFLARRWASTDILSSS
jgi:hypothetical protein